MVNIKKLPFRDDPKLIDEDLLDKTAICPVCKTHTKIPWLEKLDYPLKSKLIEGTDTYLVQKDFPIICGNSDCNIKYFVNVPVLPVENIWGLYGDDAGRLINDLPKKYNGRSVSFQCITMVACHIDKQNELKENILNLKKEIRPNVDPNSWNHHFYDIWGSNVKEKKYSFENLQEKINYANKFSKIIRDARPSLVTLNFSNAVYLPKNSIEKKSLIKYQKEILFSESIMGSLSVFRNQNKSVIWTFDNTQDTSNTNKTEGWALERFLGLQYTRLFSWIAAGSPLKEPMFVKPGSHFLLEVADFISFWIAREFFKSIKEEKIEVPSSLFGHAYYQCTLSNGDVESVWSYGLPMEKMYKLKVYS
ncbi:DUF3800 domain-containing protein [Limnobacter litoralis]|nr:DUF3800 domain-containing protein [Limnobacter litoralis]